MKRTKLIRENSLVALCRPNSKENPECTTHSLSHGRIGVCKALLDTLLKDIEATVMFKNALVAGVLVHDSLQPASSIKT